MDERRCKKCGGRLIQKPTKRTAEQLKKPYYYTAYYYCPRCNKLYHDEKFKVMNKQTESFFVDTITSEPVQYDTEIWTDGACVYNGQPNARAAWAFVSGKTERAGLVEGKQTNNVAEGLAIYNALAWAVENKYKKIKIYSDSQITINNIHKDPRLVKNNTEIFENIYRLIQTHDLTVTFEKVLGHSGDVNNERADKLCTNLAANG